MKALLDSATLIAAMLPDQFTIPMRSGASRIASPLSAAPP